MGPFGSYGRVYRKRGPLARLLRRFRRPQRPVRALDARDGQLAVYAHGQSAYAANQLGQLGTLPFTKPMVSPPVEDPWAEDYSKGGHDQPLFTYDGFGTPIPRRSPPLSSQWRAGGPGYNPSSGAAGGTREDSC